MAHTFNVCVRGESERALKTGERPATARRPSTGKEKKSVGVRGPRETGGDESERIKGRVSKLCVCQFSIVAVPHCCTVQRAAHPPKKSG